MTFIYVLKCDQEKYYVGKTNKSVIERFGEHINNPGVWTKKYKPIKIIESFESFSEFDEDTTTLKYMKKYGIDNVRGGTYTQINLPKYQYRTLQNQINHITDRCYRCNKSDHYVNNCSEILSYKTNDYKIQIKPVRKICGKMEGKWMCIIKQNNKLVKTLYSNPNEMDVLNTCAQYLKISVNEIISDENQQEESLGVSCYKLFSSCFDLYQSCFNNQNRDYIELEE